MESDMSCKCGGNYIVKDGKFVCSQCGRYALYQPGPSYEQLVVENTKLKERVAELEELIK